MLEGLVLEGAGVRGSWCLMGSSAGELGGGVLVFVPLPVLAYTPFGINVSIQSTADTSR